MEYVERPLLVIDTDVGSDDAVALLMALGHPGWDVLAITSVHGNVGVEQTSGNVLRLLEFCGRSNIPVYKGCNAALVEGLVSDLYYGEDGLGGHANHMPEPTASLQEEPAAVALIRLAKEHYKKVTIMCLGPLTNMALAHRLDPQFSQNLKEIHIMGGNMEGKGNVTACTEFNFHSDPEAADVTLREFDCPLTIVSWEVCVSHAMPWEWFDAWTSRGSRNSDLIGKMMKSAISICRHANKRPGYSCCDLLAMTALMHPETVTERVTLPVRVELNGRVTRGSMVPDWRSHTSDRHNATLCTKFDSEKLRIIWDKMVE